MKKIILFSAVVLTATLSLTQLAAKPGFPLVYTVADAAFSWVAKTYDFGKIKVGKPVTHTFNFTNNGDGALVISSVQASCGCTVTEYSKEPIAPGSEGFVKATYNAANPGVFTKTVTVNANTTNGAVLLTIKGEVVQ